MQCDTCRETALSNMARHIGEGGTSHSPAGREQRERLQYVGFARAVLTHKQVELASAVQLRSCVIAEGGESDAI